MPQGRFDPGTSPAFGYHFCRGTGVIGCNQLPGRKNEEKRLIDYQMCYYVNNMKRIIPAILLLLALTGCYNSGEPRERVLKIYNWADYIGEGVLEDFQAYYKEQTGENIRIVTRHSISTKSC